MEKFPLYEALNHARNLLFGMAKNHCYSGEEKAVKNSMAIEVQKHSGQTMSLVLSNMDMDILKKILALDEGMKGRRAGCDIDIVCCRNLSVSSECFE